MRRLALTGLLAGAAVSCEGAAPPVYVLELPQTSLTLELGEMRSAGARLLKDNTPSGEVILFTSSAPTIVSVDGSGALRGLALGTATITATAQGQSATLNVSVVPGAVITLTANLDVVGFDALGDTRQVTAEARNQFGLVITAPITWQSSNNAVAMVSATGLIRSVTRGAAQVTATAGSASDVVPVTVTQSITTVVITPSNPAVFRAETVQLTAVASDRLGARVQGVTVVWSSDNIDIVTVDQNGLVRGRGVGSTVIRADATAPALTGAASGAPAAALVGSVTVRVDPARVATVRVTPATLTIFPGATGQLTAETFDLENVLLTGRTVTWSSSAPTVATVDNNGLVSSLAVGSATITATSETRTATSAVTVSPSPIATPTITAAPTSATVVLTGSPYLGPETESHSVSEWQVDEAGQNWSTLMPGSGESSLDLTSRRITGLASTTSYQARARYRGSSATWSAYSTPVFFTTLQANRPPNTPTVTVSAFTNSAATFDGSPFVDPDPGDIHRSTEWQLDVSAGNFSNPVRTSGETMQNLTTWTVTGLAPATAYKVRVRYRDRNWLNPVDGVTGQFTGVDGWSEWSTPRTFVTNP